MTEIHSQEDHSVREKRMQDHLDHEMSLLIALVTGAHPNSCFDNILNMFLRYFPNELAAHGRFIEGWYVVDLGEEVVLNEHGWAELPNGTIIDPTVTLLVSSDRPVFYFAGAERSKQEVEAITHNKDAWFPYVRGSGLYGEDGLGHPAYKAAYEAALQKVHALATTTDPPKKITLLTAQDLDQQAQERRVVQIFIVSSGPEKGTL